MGFLQMSIRKFEQRAEFAEGIVDKLEHQCEGLNDQLFLENGKFMEMSNKLENGGSSSQTQNQQQPTVQQDRLLAPSKMELPMSPAAQAITPTNEEDQDQFILEESEVPCETEEGETEIVEKEEEEEQQQHQQQF